MAKPPVLDLKQFFELGTQPVVADPGDGQFLACNTAGTIIMAGYGGDEVVTIVFGSPAFVADDTYLRGVLLRHELGKPLEIVALNMVRQKEQSHDLYVAATARVNDVLSKLFAHRPPRNPELQDFNPLKVV